MRLPFSLSCLTEILQCKFDSLFHDLETASGIANDMISWGYKQMVQTTTDVLDKYYNTVTRRI